MVGVRGNKFSPVNPCIPVLSVVKIFQEPKDVQKSREGPTFSRKCMEAASLRVRDPNFVHAATCQIDLAVFGCGHVANHASA